MSLLTGARAARLLFVLASALLSGGLAAATADAQQLWSEVGLPGGAAGARRLAGLGTPEERSDATFLLDFIRRSGTSDLERTAKPLERYLQLMDALQSEFGRWPDGVSLPSATASDQERSSIEKFCRVVGLDLLRQRGEYRVEVGKSEEAAERAVWLKWVGIDLPKASADLNFGARVRFSISEATLPLPLPAFWAAEVFKRDVAPIVSILNARSTLWTYLGLMGLDEDTLMYLNSQPRLVRKIGEESGGAFAAFGRSLHVKTGAVQVPGGPEWLPVWEQLVSSRANQPPDFMLSLLSADGGRLAYFYDALMQLSPLRQSFVLGAHLPANRRLAFVRSVYRWFKDVDPPWSVATGPLRRPDFDPFMVLTFVDTRADGTIGPRWWSGVLERIFASQDWPSRQMSAEPSAEAHQTDAAWLLDWIFQTPAQARLRFETLRYAQRQFATTPPDLGGAVEIALRARAEMPALALSLERMGIADPRLVAALATTAHRLTAGNFNDAGPLLRRWQGALGLLEQIHLRHELPPPVLEELLQSLSVSIPAKMAESNGVVGAWVSQKLLPAVLPQIVPDADFERRAFTVFTTPRTAPETFSWEGLSYTNDPSGLVARSALAMRQSRRGPRLQDLVALTDAERRLEGPVASVADLQKIVDLFAPIEPVLATLPKRIGKFPPIARNFQDSVVRLRQITKPGDLKRVARERLVMLTTLDSVTDAVVPSILYALAGSPTSVPAVLGDAWFLHDLQDPEFGEHRRPWRDTAWQIPTGTVRQRGGTSMVGSLLAVDVALADARLVRLPAAEVPSGTIIDPGAAPAITRLLASGAWRNADGLADVVAKTIEGRRRVEAWRAQSPPTPDVARALRAALVDPWRINLMLWRASQGHAHAFDELRPTELYRLGGGDRMPEQLGAPEGFIDGCLCRARLEMPSLENLRGRRIGIGSAVAGDLSLRLAEHLTPLKLPLTLVPTLLPAAVQDWLDQISQLWLDDWEGFALWPRRVPMDRVEDYLLQLIATGAWVPAGATR
ncbi:MAG: hypothetical protein ABI051_16895 [Vicinamibacterales bacterium]